MDLYVMNQRNFNNLNSDIIISGSSFYWISKRVFDIIISFFLIPIMTILVILLFLLNPLLNKGPIFFVQKRMGKNCKAFHVLKFRTMLPSEKIQRNYDDPLEFERITSLGSFLRKSRLDEIPQILNVFKGEMSLIGPRPDFYDHACYYVENINRYKSRHAIRPGLSGLSQIRLGYASGLKDTEKKAILDCYYIENTGFLLDIKIIFGTIFIVLFQSGS